MANSERIAVIVCCGEQPPTAELLVRLSNALMSVHQSATLDTHFGEGRRGEYDGWYVSNWLLPAEPGEARVAFPVAAVRAAAEAAGLNRWPHGVVTPDGRLWLPCRFADLLSLFPDGWVVPMTAFLD